MNNKEKILDQIQEYLNDKMSSEDTENFRQKIEEDSSLREDVEKLRLLKSIAERQRLRDEIKAIHQEKMIEWRQTEEIVPVKKLNFWKISGGFAIAASVAMACFLTFSDVSYEPISSETERGNAENQDLILKKFDKNIQDLATGDAEKAILLFEDFVRIKNNPNIRPYYKDAADWYSVVALVKAKKYQEADELIKNIEARTDYKFNISNIDLWKMKWKVLIK